MDWLRIEGERASAGENGTKERLDRVGNDGTRINL